MPNLDQLLFGGEEEPVSVQPAPVRKRTTSFDSIIEEAATTFGIDPNVAKGVAIIEGANPTAISSAGAVGVMQLLPRTAQEVAASLGEEYSEDKLRDPPTNIRWGIKYLSDQIKRFGVPSGVAAYQAGPGNVLKAGGGIPNTTDGITATPKYVATVLSLAGQDPSVVGEFSATKSDIEELLQPKILQPRTRPGRVTRAEEPPIPRHEQAPAAEAPAQPEITFPGLKVSRPTMVPLTEAAPASTLGVEPTLPTPPAPRLTETPEARAQVAAELFEGEREPTPSEEARRAEVEAHEREQRRAGAEAVLGAVEELPGGKIITRTAAVGGGLVKVIPFAETALTAIKGDDSAREALQKLYPVETAAGQITGTMLQAFAGGPIVAKKLAVIKNPLLRNMTTRALLTGGFSGVKGVEDVIAGKRTFNEAFWDTVQAAGAGAFSAVPELASGFSVAGLRIPWQVVQAIGQPLADLAYDATVDAMRGREVGTGAWWAKEIPSLGLATGFALRDIASGQQFVVTQEQMRKSARGALRGLFTKTRGLGKQGFEIQRAPAAAVPTEPSKLPPAPGEAKVLPIEEEIPTGFEEVRTQPEGEQLELFPEMRVEAEADVPIVTRPTAEARAERPPGLPPPPEPTVREEIEGLTQPRPVTEADAPELFKTGQRTEVLTNQTGAVKISGAGPEAPAVPAQVKPAGRIAKGFKKWFSSEGLLPTAAYQQKVVRDGQINNYMRDLDKTVSDFRKASKKSYGKTRLTDEQAFEIDAALKGEKPLEELPEAMQPVVRNMRLQIDALSQRMIDEGLVQGDLAGVVSDNMGYYANRSYRVFQDPKWAKNVPPEVRENAKAFLRHEVTTRHLETAEDIEARLNTLAGKKAALQARERVQPLAPVDERMLQLRLRTEGVIDKSERETIRGIRQIATEIKARRRSIMGEMQRLNEQKTKLFRERPVRPSERPRFLKEQAALQRKLTVLEQQAEEVGLPADEALSLLDEVQGQLAETMSQLRLEPTRVPDIGANLAAINGRLNNLEAQMTKLGYKKGDRVIRLIDAVQRRTDRIVSNINEARTQIWRGPAPDISPELKPIPQRIESIDQRIDELGTKLTEVQKRAQPTEEELEGLIDNLLYKEGAPISVLSSGTRLGAKNLSMLRKRKEIPAQIRALWGEYKNADVNYANSVAKMSHALANNEFLNEVLTVGEGNFFFREPITKGGESYSVRIAAPSSSAMAPLNGMYTTPEIKQAFEEAVEREVLSDWYRLAMRGIGTVKYAKTIGSFMTHVRNTTGNIQFAVANGHFNVKEMPTAFRATFGDIVRKAPPELEGEIRDLIGRGVLSDGARAGELRGIIQDATQGNIDVLVGTGTKQTARRGLKLAEKLYGAEDDVWKWYAFRNEYSRYRKALPNVPEEELRGRVANIIRDTYPTYSKVPRAIKKLRRFPFVGTFVSFPAEVIRTAKNTIGLIGQELRDPALKGIGAQRLVGSMIAATLPAAMSIGSRYLTGTTKKKEEAMREFQPPWSENSQIIHTGEGDDLHRSYIDLGYTDPHSYLRNPVIAFMRGEDWESKVYESVGEMFSPFLSEDILAQKMFDLKRNKTQAGQPVYNAEDSPENIALDIATHMAEAFEPGTISGIRRMYKAAVGEEGKAGTPYDFKTEVIAQATGVRVSKMDVPRSLRFKTFLFRNRLSDARRLAFKRGTELSEEQTIDILKDFGRTVDAAYTLGMNKGRIRSSLMRGGLSRIAANSLITGNYEAYAKSLTTKRKKRARGR